MGKHCAYGLCTSDVKKKDPKIKFAPFPKPWLDPLRAQRWVHLCGRQGFTIANISKQSYVCSLHFPPGQLLDWKENPDLEPIPVGVRIIGEKTYLLEKLMFLDILSQNNLHIT